MSTPEQVTQSRILIRIGSHRDIRVWRNNTGTAWQPMTDSARNALKSLCASMPGEFRPVQYGSPGSPDILGVIAPRGRILGIEVKSPEGMQSPAQKVWEEQYTKRGALYVLARKEQDVADALAVEGINV